MVRDPEWGSAPRQTDWLTDWPSVVERSKSTDPYYGPGECSTQPHVINYSLNIHFNIILLPKLMPSKLSLLFRFFSQTSVNHNSYACYISSPYKYVKSSCNFVSLWRWYHFPTRVPHNVVLARCYIVVRPRVYENGWRGALLTQRSV
jgi:hypothetical protein